MALAGNRLHAAVLMLLCGAPALGAQTLDELRPQIHGFAAESFVLSDANNYIGLNSSAGSASWNEAAININEQVTDRLRVGVQLHVTRLGAFGGDTPSLDWALGDYTVDSRLGLRAGKVKIKWGLFNDTQDFDPGYLWSLLPEPVYGIDSRATNLSQYGAEAYGDLPLGSAGKLTYSAYYGDYFYATNDGYAASFAQQGLSFAGQAGGKTPGVDLRWATPVKGLQVAASLMVYNATGNLAGGGTFAQPWTFWPTYYATYDRKRLSLAGQYVRLVQYQTVAATGAGPVTSGSDARSWFAMGSYRVRDRLQVGAYYTRYVLASAADRTDPANYFRDAVVSGRYDIDPHFYAKLEGHFIDGNGVGFYTLNNPGNLAPRTNLVVAKVGFIF